MSDNEKQKALKLTIDKIEKDFGKGSVMMMNEFIRGFPSPNPAPWNSVPASPI